MIETHTKNSTEKFLIFGLLNREKFKARQATDASFVSQKSSQIVPHVSLIQISTRPSPSTVPSANLSVPVAQSTIRQMREQMLMNTPLINNYAHSGLHDTPASSEWKQSDVTGS